jgi:hypothetical protein
MTARKKRLSMVSFGFTALLVFTVGVIVLNMTTYDDRWVEIPYEKRQ